MGESGASIDASKILLTVLGPIVAAAIGASTLIYKHEKELLRRQQEISKLSVQVYRQHIKTLEMWESHMRAQIQLLLLTADDQGKLSKSGQAYFNYYTQTKDAIVILKENYVEEHKHEGRVD